MTPTPTGVDVGSTQSRQSCLRSQPLQKPPARGMGIWFQGCPEYPNPSAPQATPACGGQQLPHFLLGQAGVSTEWPQKRHQRALLAALGPLKHPAASRWAGKHWPLSGKPWLLSVPPVSSAIPWVHCRGSGGSRREQKIPGILLTAGNGELRPCSAPSQPPWDSPAPFPTLHPCQETFGICFHNGLEGWGLLQPSRTRDGISDCFPEDSLPCFTMETPPPSKFLSGQPGTVQVSLPMEQEEL